MKFITKIQLLAVSAFAVVSFAAPVSASIIPSAPGSLTQCPIVGAATTCALLFRFNANGSVDTLTDSTVLSTDSIEDTLVGVLNLSGHSLASIFLDGGALAIFGFDGDGISSVVGVGPGATYFGHYDATAPGSQDGVNTFSPVSSTKGTVLFGTGIVDGGSGWFVLEEQVSFTAPPTVGGVPEPETLALMGLGMVGLLAVRRRKQQA